MAPDGSLKETMAKMLQGFPSAYGIVIFISFILMVLFGLATVGFIEDNMVTSVTYSIDASDIPIVTLSERSSVNGHFSLGSGSVGESGVYVYYVKTGDVTYKRATVNSDYTSIVMDEENVPYLRELTMMETTCTRTGCKTYHDYFSPARSSEGWYLGYKRWEFHVPNGTLVVNDNMRVGP